MGTSVMMRWMLGLVLGLDGPSGVWSDRSVGRILCFAFFACRVDARLPPSIRTVLLALHGGGNPLFCNPEFRIDPFQLFPHLQTRRHGSDQVFPLFHILGRREDQPRTDG